MSAAYVYHQHKVSRHKQQMVSFDEDDELNLYSSDSFRMFEFKIRFCTRSRSHDWTDCPFAHPGEKARRRDPRRYRYSAKVCSDFRQGVCTRGDNCEFAHGVFESWLHPSRYRTEACKDGKKCKRKVCFFAHTPAQLRSPSDDSCMEMISDKDLKSVMSPTSTLLGLSNLSPSPPLSPPSFNQSNLTRRFVAGGYMHGHDELGFSELGFFDLDLRWVEDLLQ